MSLRKITGDNIIRYIPKNEQTKEGGIKPNKIKDNATPGKQNEKISRNIKKLLNNISASGFKYITKY